MRLPPPPQFLSKNRPVANKPDPRPAGVSLIIAILFVSFFLLALASLAESQLATLRNIRNRELDGKLFYLAESAGELAALWAARHGEGANMKDDSIYLNTLIDDAEDLFNITNCENTDNDPNTLGPTCVGVEVIGSEGAAVSLNGEAGTFFSAPIRGTGSAGVNCSLENAPVNLDDPCNWNRLKVGQAVEMPLYYWDYSANPAGAVVKAIGSGKKFRLRIRTPCDMEKVNSETSKQYAAGDSCASTDRVDLYPLVGSADYRDPKKDKVLVQWTITEGDTIQTSRTLIANDVKTSGARKDDPIRNTEISSGRIQDAKNNSDGKALQNYDILFENHKGEQISASEVAISAFTATQPILRLTFVSRPKRNRIDTDTTGPDFSPEYIPAEDANDTTYDLPYLEYQILSTAQFADSKSVIIGKAEFGDFKKEYRSEKERPATLGGFVLESF